MITWVFSHFWHDNFNLGKLTSCETMRGSRMEYYNKILLAINPPGTNICQSKLIEFISALGRSRNITQPCPIFNRVLVKICQALISCYQVWIIMSGYPGNRIQEECSWQINSTNCFTSLWKEGWLECCLHTFENDFAIWPIAQKIQRPRKKLECTSQSTTPYYKS